MALFPCFRWSFAKGKTPIPKIGMEADFREQAQQGFFTYTTTNKGATSMKTRNQFFGLIAIAIMAIAIIGCKQDASPTPTPQEQAKVQPDTPRTLAFGTDCKVTITSTDIFTDAEWTTLCDKVVAAIERGYKSFNIMAQQAWATYLANYTVSAVLLKSATYDAEVKSTVPKTMYFKANASAIDGLTADNMVGILNTVYAGDSSYHLP